MELLIDTHVLFWLENDPKALGDRLALFEDPANAIYVSAASVWEIAVKRAKGKLAFAGSVCEAIERRGFIHLPISAQHAELAGMLPQHHADPIDRLMVAQALLEQLTLATRDSVITKYTVPILRV